MGSDLLITRDESGDYSIYKLTYMEGASGAYDISTGALSFSGTAFDFYPEKN